MKLCPLMAGKIFWLVTENMRIFRKKTLEILIVISMRHMLFSSTVRMYKKSPCTTPDVANSKMSTFNIKCFCVLGKVVSGEPFCMGTDLVDHHIIPNGYFK